MIRNILYIGQDNPHTTSYHRAQALVRLGFGVRIVNPYPQIGTWGSRKVANILHYKTGYRLLQPKMAQWIKRTVLAGPEPDLVWVDSGELLGAGCLAQLRGMGKPIVNFNADDPTGLRDGRRFDMLLQAIPGYDLCVVKREINVQEYLDRGARHVWRSTLSYDEVAHAPLEAGNPLLTAYASDVAFIGTWMRHEQRDRFLLELVRDGIQVSIWGSRWEKSPYWNELKGSYRGGYLGGENYVAAIQGSKICIGMLSKGNRDTHTNRTFEIPYIGSVLCAERTPEHTSLYREGEEAVFWSDAAECAALCRSLLANPDKRETIRMAGMARVRALRVGNQDVCKRIIEQVYDISRHTDL